MLLPIKATAILLLIIPASVFAGSFDINLSPTTIIPLEPRGGERSQNDSYISEDTKLKQKKLVDIFMKAGIKKNQPMWLKYPQYQSPALTKVTIEDVSNYNNEQVEVLFTLARERFYTVDDLKRMFFLKPVHNKWSKKALSAIKSGKIFIGMSADQAIASWGLPENINETVGRWGRHEQWIYSGNYLYFENGKLTSWQTTQ